MNWCQPMNHYRSKMVKWWRMNEDQKERQMHKFHTCSLKEQASEDIVQYKGERPKDPKKHVIKKGSSSNQATLLGISMQLVLESTHLPIGTISGILEKAQSLVDNKSAISPVPDGSHRIDLYF